jgi:hypothetical protein
MEMGQCMPTNLRRAPFAAAAFVLVVVVKADAQSPATSSGVIPPIPPGQARVWVYSDSQPASPNYYPHMEVVTLDGVNVGYSQLGFLRRVGIRPFGISQHRRSELCATGSLSSSSGINTPLGA